MENNEGLVSDVELENTLKNITGNTEFFETEYDPDSGWIWNGYPNKISNGTQ